ncbi:hypothetical protein C8R45DRAFT_1012557 [Mycena sanguinolenta]|nr:hypothetical protein C8R45DRAFT_1012557 [Mycena sanguinolenta]
MVSPQNVLRFALFVFFSSTMATPIETPPDGFYVQFPAYAREAPSRLIKLVPTPAWNRVSRATCPLHTLDTGSESFRRIVAEAVESSGSASSSSCRHEFVIILVVLAVLLAVSVVLNVALSIRLTAFVNRRRRELEGGIPLGVHRPRPRAAAWHALSPPPQMASTDSAVTLVPRFV